jgi:UPF0271 protein
MKSDVNCDLGEGESLAATRALMRWITSANVACGGHAGDAKTMELCVRLAKRYGVRLGAHPGAWNRSDFGRGQVDLSADELELLLLHQVSALAAIAREHGVRLHHIKLHGALYHASESSEALARRYVARVARSWPRVIIYARASGLVVRLARRNGVEAWEEAFVDRSYQDDGSLVPRSEPTALITDTQSIIQRVLTILDREGVATVSGKRIGLRPQTLCLHSDTPQAVELARALGKFLGERRSPQD